ncbi:MAG: bifunctional riboflavin kinase/FAD synthetase [Lachnospiraceae bacterium]|nr:bifunctional riboflavin kinase/FAD synthetase [Lachnospiraceae bacterium]
MQIVRDLNSFFELNKESTETACVKSAVAIGKFDGIHIGHRALLQCIINKKKENMRAVVFTFSPSPEEFFRGQLLPAIDTAQEKRDNFAKMGVDILIEYPLTKESAAISPQSFMEDILFNGLNAGYVVSGRDLSFGNKGAGNADMLQAFAAEKDFVYEMIDKVCIDGNEVSSTSVREAVVKGDMEKVCRMLGRRYCVGGEVVHGKALGRTIQMPTINIIPAKEKLLPPSGVYATVTLIDGREYPGVTNIGVKPTVTDEKVVGVETHLFDFDENVYGKYVVTELVSYIRPEKRFASVEDMLTQIKADCVYAKDVLQQ